MIFILKTLKKNTGKIPENIGKNTGEGRKKYWGKCTTTDLYTRDE